MNEASLKSVVLVHSDEYANWVFDNNHPTQGRRFMNARNAFMESAGKSGIKVREVKPVLASRADLELVHSSNYVQEVLDNHTCNEWDEERADLAELANLFAGGTLVALDQLIGNQAQIAIHFPGAKHHAQYDYSSGFCVFADFAIAAEIATNRYGKRVAILDIDAHHGDGTENLTRDNSAVLSFSIHEYGIFPGTGLHSQPEKRIYDFPLGTSEGEGDLGRDDDALYLGIKAFLSLAKEFAPDLIFIACGADGHKEDPLSNLRYTVDGYVGVATLLREAFPNTPFLIGGAGGYLPDSRTPEVWSEFAIEISKR